MKRISVHTLIENYEQKQRGHYFKEETLKFFGDRISNYYVRTNTEVINGVECYVLARRKPVKFLSITKQDDTYFSVKNFEVISPKTI